MKQLTGSILMLLALLTLSSAQSASYSTNEPVDPEAAGNPVRVSAATVNVGYITCQKDMDASACTPDDDPIIRMLQHHPEFTVEVKVVTGTSVVDLTGYDVVVVQEGFGSGDLIYKPGGSLGLQNIKVPFVYNKAYALRDGRAVSSATSSAGELPDQPVITVEPGRENHPLFSGIPMPDNAIQVFKFTANDLGAPGTKSNQYAQNLEMSDLSTLLAKQKGAPSNVSVAVNDIPAGTVLGTATTLQARMIAISQNFGAICRDDGNNMTNAGLTLWRNAIFLAAGLEVPDTLYKLPEPSEMAGYWKMDDGSGTVVSDEMGLSDGTLVNPGNNVWVDGYIGKAIDMTAKGSPDTSLFVHIPGEAVDYSSSENFSISVIAKLDISVETEQSLVSKGMPFADNGGWYHFSYRNGAGRFMVWDSIISSHADGLFPADFPQNDWVHFVCVKDVEEDMLKVYLNGYLLASHTDETEADISNDGDLYIGTVPNRKTDCIGAIDEVIIYNKALNDFEVLELSQSYGFQFIGNTSDATLADLLIEGTTVDGFASGLFTYDVKLPSGTTTVPNVTATPTSENATVVITPATSLPGATTVQVTAENGVNELTYTINFTVAPAGIEPGAIAGISIFPNPAHQTLTVTGAGNSTLSVCELNGVIMKSGPYRGETAKIDISDLGAGIYILRIEMEDKIAVTRFVKE
ncbi:MAG: T9SS type A sorting domain-containing protein [Bacteroidales bacterium]|nr:T9SS type A sorting domain-containing protein [Bacteroidales bacterium]